MIGWKELKLGNIAKVISGYAFKSTDFLKDNGIPVIKIKNIKNGDIDLNECDYVSLKYLSLNEKYHLKRNDILVSLTGSHITQPNSVVGRIALYRNNLTSLLNQRAGKILPNTHLVDRHFLYAYLSQASVKEAIASKARGAANQANISPGDVEDTDILLPSLSTQRRIASILSAYDDLIENNLKRIKLLEELAHLTYEEWFAKFRVNGEQLEVNTETGLPEGWDLVKVGSLLDNIKSSGKTLSSEIRNEGKYPVIDQSRDFIAGFINDESKLVNSNHPIIIFGDHTRILKFINFPFARGADGTQVILSKNKRMPQHLFYHMLMNTDLSNYHYARHFKYLKECSVVLPTVEISEHFENNVKPKFDLIKNLRNQNRLLKVSRDILLPRLMSGKIEVEELKEKELSIAAEPDTLYKNR